MKSSRPWVPAHALRDESGGVAIIVGISLLLLMGFTALAIDAGVGYNQRRGTQNAADNAALAAAWEDCNPKSAAMKDPEAAARKTALENGYDHSDTAVDVHVTDLNEGKWEVEITTTDPTTFGQATPYAPDQVTVVSSAVAECKAIPFLGGYALFANAPPSCGGGVELDLSGSSKIIHGGIHSNGKVKITGSPGSTDIQGDVTHVGGTQPHWPGAIQVMEPIDYPLDVAIADYRPGGSRAAVYDSADPALDRYFDTDNLTTSWLLTNGYAKNVDGSLEMQKPGVYYTTGSIHITDEITMAPNVKVTWVAEGSIKFTKNIDIAGFDPVVGGAADPGIAIFSNYEAPPSGPTCVGDAISLKGESSSWTGVLFAPFGRVAPSFSGFNSLNGSIIGYTLNVSGANFQISWTDNPDAVPDFEVNLLR